MNSYKYLLISHQTRSLSIQIRKHMQRWQRNMKRETVNFHKYVSIKQQAINTTFHYRRVHLSITDSPSKQHWIVPHFQFHTYACDYTPFVPDTRACICKPYIQAFDYMCTIHDPYAKYVHICALCSYTTCTVLVHIICMYVQAPPTVDNLIYTTHSPFQQHTNKRSLPSIKHPTFSSPCLAQGASCLAWK